MNINQPKGPSAGQPPRSRADLPDGYAQIMEAFSLNPRAVAMLAGGCFWGVQELLRQLPGVISLTVGYSGGRTIDPTYEQVRTGSTGHAEAVEVIYDPARLSYADLLRYFFRLHDPTTINAQGFDRGTQYRSVIFYFDEAQRRIAEEIKREVDLSDKWSAPVATQILPAGPFYRAEEYHQNYLQKHPEGYSCHFLRD